ncbi:MAG TPA: nucleotide sugar dehydrogenase [Caldilineaceae bacterium]|nr:nucleotide sugar dehydrogenase [Caldilineaceae bacterium]
MQSKLLLDKFNNRQATVAVIGLGYVGLPLAVAFAEAGFRVIGVDIQQSRVDMLNQGTSHIPDVASETIRRLAATPTAAPVSATSQAGAPVALATEPPAPGAFRATTDYDSLREADAAIICVPTPLGKTKDPDLSLVAAAVEAIAQRLHRGMLIVLESTTYPGTTLELVLPRLQEATGQRLTVGEDFFLAFSPERIDPGRQDWTVRNTPKVIGGVTAACTQVASALYGCAIETVAPVSSPSVAEMVKLLENTFRAVNIALVNEVAIMCDRLGIDVWEVIEAAKTKPFGFMSFYPGPGLGGHCIPVDPHYLAWKLKTLNYNARFIQLAAEINYAMPEYVLGKIINALNLRRKALNGARILVMGVAYKADVGDIRESPALDLIHLLRQKGVQVCYHDPYVPRLDGDELSLESSELNEELLREMDCVVIATAHSIHNWPWIVAHSQLIIDTRNATHGIAAAAPDGDAAKTASRIVKL